MVSLFTNRTFPGGGAKAAAARKKNIQMNSVKSACLPRIKSNLDLRLLQGNALLLTFQSDIAIDENDYAKAGLQLA
jgi:hypothetical protein